MEKQLLPNADPQTRRDSLEAESVKIVEGEKYDRRLTDEEIEDRRATSLRLLDQLDDISAEKKAVMDDFKAKTSEVSKKLGTARTEAKTGITTEVGKLYYIPDYEARKMGIYNEHGELINSRGLLPEERQQNMFVVSRSGTND